MKQIIKYGYEQLKTGSWLHQKRVQAYLRIALVLQMMAVIYIVLAAYKIIHWDSNPTSTDFLSFYAAGFLADHGTPELAYNLAAHGHAEQLVAKASVPYFAFFYPPVFLLICSVLAKLPYLLAFASFTGLTLFFFLRAIAPLLPKQTFPVAAVASPTVLLAMGSGQNSFLTAGLFGWAMLLLPRRPYLSGLLLGAMCYKPHFGLLIPIALFAAYEWKAILGAATSVAGLVLVSFFEFGTKTWSGYQSIQRLSFQTFENGWVNYSQQASVFASIRSLGVSTNIAYACQLIVAATVVLCVALVWHKSHQRSSKTMVLTIGSTLIPPVFLNYDVVLAGVGMAWLVYDASQTGYRHWEKLTLLAAYVVTAFSAWSGLIFHVNLSPWIMILLFALAFRRARETWAAEIPVNDYRREAIVA